MKIINDPESKGLLIFVLWFELWSLKLPKDSDWILFCYDFFYSENEIQAPFMPIKQSTTDAKLQALNSGAYQTERKKITNDHSGF